MEALKEEINAGRSYRHQMRVRFLWSRDGPGCFYCGLSLLEADATLDHFIPRSLGGMNCLENLRVACERCNAAKADLHPDDFRGGGSGSIVKTPRDPSRTMFNGRWVAIATRPHPRAIPAALSVSLADVWPEV